MEDPIPQFTHLVETLKSSHPDLSYLHAVGPNVQGDVTHHGAKTTDSIDFIRKIWAPKPLITAGGYTRDIVTELSAKHENELFAFGKLFIANVRSCTYHV